LEFLSNVEGWDEERERERERYWCLGNGGCHLIAPELSAGELVTWYHGTLHSGLCDHSGSDDTTRGSITFHGQRNSYVIKEREKTRKNKKESENQRISIVN